MTTNEAQRSRGIARLATESSTRSMARNRGLTARPLEDSELVAEDEDLEVLGTVIVATDSETEETSEHPDDERQEEQHRASYDPR